MDRNLFALGHGTVVTCIAVMISRFSHSWNFPQVVWNVLDWIPGLLLILVGFLNFRMLRAKKSIRQKDGKRFCYPKLKNSSHPLSIVLIGILFAMVFDTNTQAAAWAYTPLHNLAQEVHSCLDFLFRLG